ncbi:MAG: NAD(+) synthase [Clostridia bacterium]|nr:NAD(+) synthase [Clostridia bacterium]MDY5264086.1 NAD(+) synthase [Eubacteriales bacterium]MDY5439670.1 NAD(+) synthase [Eubacteriales bacterium]
MELKTEKEILQDVEKRVSWIKKVLETSRAKGIVFGNSGGKDCTLVGILCKKATENVECIIMPCEAKRNFLVDKNDALLVCDKYDIKHLEVDLTPVKKAFREVLNNSVDENNVMAYANINPRIRMTTLYAYAYEKNYLVAGTGNRSERVMGYFTKFGDGGYDFNPISDLTATEVFRYLEVLNAPREIIDKAPSAGLFEGQTDEKEMGLTYKDLDTYILTGEGTDELKNKVDATYNRTKHKRAPLLNYPNEIE